MLKSRPIVAAFADTLFPLDPDAPAGSAVVPDALEDLLASMDEAAVKQLGMALVLFEIGAVPLYGRRFSKLSAERRERYVRGSMRSRFPVRRAIFRALRGLCASLYYADARSWPLIGYDGPPVLDTGR
jgi:hypothetical protein